MSSEELARPLLKLPTMWIGAEFGCLYIHSALTNLRKCLYAKKVRYPRTLCLFFSLSGCEGKQLKFHCHLRLPCDDQLMFDWKALQYLSVFLSQSFFLLFSLWLVSFMSSPTLSVPAGLTVTSLLLLLPPPSLTHTYTLSLSLSLSLSLLPPPPQVSLSISLFFTFHSFVVMYFCCLGDRWRPPSWALCRHGNVSSSPCPTARCWCLSDIKMKRGTWRTRRPSSCPKTRTLCRWCRVSAIHSGVELGGSCLFSILTLSRSL